MVITEGIETGLAVLQTTAMPVWAASASLMQSIVLPSEVTSVIICADADDAGEAAARNLGKRLFRKERDVRIARPPRCGDDFDDVLRNGIA